MAAIADIKVTVEVEVTVPGEWIEFCTRYSDLFSRDYIGYWACGIVRDNDRGWLLYASGQTPPSKLGRRDPGMPPSDRVERRAKAAWLAGTALPRGFFRLDREAAIDAYCKGCKQWGVDWYDKKGDSITYDFVVQLALLGEAVYG